MINLEGWIKFIEKKNGRCLREGMCETRDRSSLFSHLMSDWEERHLHLLSPRNRTGSSRNAKGNNDKNKICRLNGQNFWVLHALQTLYVQWFLHSLHANKKTHKHAWGLEIARKTKKWEQSNIILSSMIVFPVWYNSFLRGAPCS